jgi:hypothetical protein
MVCACCQGEEAKVSITIGGLTVYCCQTCVDATMICAPCHICETLVKIGQAINTCPKCAKVYCDEHETACCGLCYSCCNKSLCFCGSCMIDVDHKCQACHKFTHRLTKAYMNKNWSSCKTGFLPMMVCCYCLRQDNVTRYPNIHVLEHRKCICENSVCPDDCTYECQGCYILVHRVQEVLQPTTYSRCVGNEKKNFCCECMKSRYKPSNHYREDKHIECKVCLVSTCHEEKLLNCESCGYLSHHLRLAPGLDSCCCMCKPKDTMLCCSCWGKLEAMECKKVLRLVLMMLPTTLVNMCEKYAVDVKSKGPRHGEYDGRQCQVHGCRNKTCLAHRGKGRKLKWICPPHR